MLCVSRASTAPTSQVLDRGVCSTEGVGHAGALGSLELLTLSEDKDTTRVIYSFPGASNAVEAASEGVPV